MLAVRSVARHARAARAFHTSRPVGSDHGHYHHLPFPWPKNKAAFGTSVAAYLGFGFFIPFGAAIYQLKKSAGSD